jgi:tetratricopeptide (TPR) repeat protein
MPPAAVQSEQAARIARLARRGPVLSALLFTSFRWEPQDGAISKLRKLIEITSDDDVQKPDFWYRLGQTHAWYFDHTPGSAPTAELQRAEAHFSEAVAAYRAAMTYKGYDRMDGVLFVLARLYFRAQEVESARVYVDRLHREYPVSRHVPQVDILYADYLANDNQLAAALAWYSTAAQYDDAATQPYAIYGKAWCFLQRGDVEAARYAFGEAIRAAERASTWSQNRTVSSQSARDLAAIDRVQR